MVVLLRRLLTQLQLLVGGQGVEGNRVHIFDEQDFVSDFAVDQFVDDAACEQKAVASAAHSFLFAVRDVVEWIGRCVCDSGVVERFAAEAGAGVAYMEDHGASGLNGGDFDDLFGVEGCAVLHGVEEDLAEGLHELLTGVFGELGAELAGEGEEAFGGDDAAVYADRDPAGPGGEDLQVVAPLVVGCGAAGEVGDLVGIEGRSEAGEDAGAERGDDFDWRALMGEDDAFDAGADGAHLSEEGEVFFDGAVGAGEDDAEGAGAEFLEGVGVAGGVFHRKLGGGERVADSVTDLSVASDDENPAHGGLRGDG